MTTPAWSDLTVTDVFCGAGGNTIGAKKAGLRVRVGLNHWKRAIETYKTNNPEVEQCEPVDVSLCDPRRYRSTDIAIMSPECTTHSPAGGNRHKRRTEADLFSDGEELDPATQRSRVTMFDVVRFTEYHRYRLVIIENVVEATRWELFPDWLRMMDALGYHHRILSLNSMFFHPTPQSRDRIYVVFWRKGNREPNLEYRPPAPCAKCGVVEAVQVWKNGRTIGKYKRQYLYACPRCAEEVTPFYFAALNALDFSLAAERIGDRVKPLKARTMDRIRYGLEKYGNRTLVVNLKQGARDSSRAWPSPFIMSQHEGRASGIDAAVPAVPTVPGHYVVQPGFLVETAQTHSGEKRARDFCGPMATQSAQQTSALVMAPFLITAGSNESMGSSLDPAPTQTGTERLGLVSPFFVRMRGTADDQMKHASSGADDALATQGAGGVHDAVVQPAPFIVMRRGGDHGAAADGVVPTVTATGEAQHLVVSGAAQISMRDANAMRVAGLDRELMTQGCGMQQALIQKAPFLTSYYGSDQATPGDAPVAAITTVDRHSVVTPELRVEDCYFRMLQPHEIGAAMAFPYEYEVGGNKREKVKQYGNAVTPPVMDWIVRQCAATLAPELEDFVADVQSAHKVFVERADGENEG